MSNNTKITFENTGQDYTTWVITPQGRVIDSQPFHSPSLAHIQVLDTTFARGQKILYKKDGQVQALPFKIVKVEQA